MKSKILFFLCLFLCLPLFVYADTKTVTFHKCIDGDTAKFKLNGKKITVRFLAIDAPEIKHSNQDEEPFGVEAKNYTCKTLTNAKNIQLEYDEASHKKDNYNRHLAWIWVDGKLLQKKLIQKGYAKVAYIYGDYKYVDILKKEEEKAQRKKIGIWSNEDYKYLNNNSSLLDSIDFNNMDFSHMDYYSLFISLLIILILFLFFPKYRRKTVRKAKKDFKQVVENLEKK